IKRWIDAGAPMGAAATGSVAPKPTPESLPMPVNRTALDVTLPTKAELPADLLEKGAKTLTLKLTIGPLPPVTALAYRPDGKSLYTASLDHNARRFDVDKGALVRLFTGHNDAITALAVSPDGKRLVTSGGEPNLRWWNVDTGDTTNNNGGHSASVAEIA